MRIDNTDKHKTSSRSVRLFSCYDNKIKELLETYPRISMQDLFNVAFRELLSLSPTEFEAAFINFIKDKTHPADKRKVALKKKAIPEKKVDMTHY